MRVLCYYSTAPAVAHIYTHILLLLRFSHVLLFYGLRKGVKQAYNNFKFLLVVPFVRHIGCNYYCQEYQGIYGIEKESKAHKHTITITHLTLAPFLKGSINHKEEATEQDGKIIGIDGCGSLEKI